MKAWLYSANSAGVLRASWAMDIEDVEALEEGAAAGAVEAAQAEAGQALVSLEADKDEARALGILRRSLLSIAAHSDAWRAIQPHHWQEGIQVIVVDYLLPDNSAMFLTFTFPYHLSLDADQLAQLVGRVVSGQGGCCG